MNNGFIGGSVWAEGRLCLPHGAGFSSSLCARSKGEDGRRCGCKDGTPRKLGGWSLRPDLIRKLQKAAVFDHVSSWSQILSPQTRMGFSLSSIPPILQNPAQKLPPPQIPRIAPTRVPHSPPVILCSFQHGSYRVCKLGFS